ncbi:iron transporter, partial [Streptomyces gramineus]
ADSRETIRTVLEKRADSPPHADPYVASEQSLVFGHRFHPTPKVPAAFGVVGEGFADLVGEFGEGLPVRS